MKWNLKQIAEWTEAQILSEVQTEFSAIGTDTRKNLTGQVFIALKGDQFDAHQFLKQAVDAKAACLLVHELKPEFEVLKKTVSILLVKDTLIALQVFAKKYRQSLATKIIGITGSNGKTTTKEFTAQILSDFKKTHYNKGSFNNHWGVPITLLEIEKDTAFAVIEMGMNHAGEITQLVQIADPDFVVCTMVGTAHIEFLKTKENIAKAKSEIYLDAKESTVRIFNQDQDLTYDMMYPVAKKFPASRMLSFSDRNPEADVFFKIEKLTMQNIKITGLIGGIEGTQTIPIFGKQNLTNLMAASCLAYACGMQPEKIWQALVHCKTAWGRNQFLKTHTGAEVLFDGYNANPDSMAALIDNLSLLEIKGKKIGVFGQMKELGTEAKAAHIELGLKAGHAGFSHIYFIGEDYQSFHEGIKQSGYKGSALIEKQFVSSLGENLKANISAGDIVVIKGSRGAETERFVDYCDAIDWQKK